MNNFRYADNTGLMAESESELQKLVEEVRKNGGEKGLRMNAKETKTMYLNRDRGERGV